MKNLAEAETDIVGPALFKPASICRSRLRGFAGDGIQRERGKSLDLMLEGVDLALCKRGQRN
jgi:hypothetical protein